MRLKRPPVRQPPETIIALIDVVFFLLVFFMLIGRMDATAPFDVSPPTAATGANMPAGGLTVSVSKSGEIAVGGVLIEKNDLDQEIRTRLTEGGETLVRVNAHRAAELRHVLPLVSQIEALGAQDVVLVVTPEASPPAN